MGRYGPLYLPNMAILVRMPPCEPISMNQDDSKQWEYLLSQENDPSWSDLAPLNLHSISRRSRAISATSVHEPCYQKRQLGPRKLTSTKMDDLGL